MTDIQKFKHPDGITQKIKAALIEKKIVECSETEIVLSISPAINKAIFYLGYKITDADSELLKLMVIDDIKKSFINLSLPEVVIAIENGYRGIYGEVFGLAPKDVYNWLNSYIHDQVRRNAKKEIQCENDFDNEPSDEEKKKLFWFNLMNAWEIYKKNGFYNDIGNAIYSTLSINKKIEFTEEQRSNFKERAKAIVIAEFNPEKHFGNDIKMKEAMKMVNSVKSGTQEQRVIAEAKRIALNEFFADLLKSGNEIEDLFK